MATVLIVDDDADFRRLLVAGLGAHGHRVVETESGARALEAIAEEAPDIVLTDVMMPAMSGPQLCARIAEAYSDLPVLVLTAFGTVQSAVEALRAGARDYVMKPINLDALAIVIGRVLEERALRARLRRLGEVMETDATEGPLLGLSAAMRRLRDLVARVAVSDASALVVGGSGTGKELVARMLHDKSARRHGPFVAINCAALPESLLESELFGHVKGAFTDARTDRAGLFQRAHNGTLFLDEIGELPIGLQAKLLRVLEDHLVRPVGTDKGVEVDFRLVTATHRDLEAAIAERSFREDLFFRVSVVQIDVPRLSEREGDILILAQHFTRYFAARSQRRVDGMSPAAARRLLTYAWPGNVRELRNVVERAVALARSSEITVEDLPDRVREFAGLPIPASSAASQSLPTLEEFERRYIAHVLGQVSGNRTLASEILGLDRKTLYRKLVRFA